MPTITVNAEPKSPPDPLTVADLLRHLGKDPKKLAVEVNRNVVMRTDHLTRHLSDGDAVEIVTLVGGGSGAPEDKPLQVAGFTFRSRLFTGTGKYASYELMQQCMDASGCEVTTVAVRRERLIDKDGKSLLDFLTSTAHDPTEHGRVPGRRRDRHAARARGTRQPGNPGELGELQCLADKRTLLPDPVDTLKATERLVKEGFRCFLHDR